MVALAQLYDISDDRSASHDQPSLSPFYLSKNQPLYSVREAAFGSPKTGWPSASDTWCGHLGASLIQIVARYRNSWESAEQFGTHFRRKEWRQRLAHDFANLLFGDA